jgi:hypothetical protein
MNVRIHIFGATMASGRPSSLNPHAIAFPVTDDRKCPPHLIRKVPETDGPDQTIDYYHDHAACAQIIRFTRFSPKYAS